MARGLGEKRGMRHLSLILPVVLIVGCNGGAADDTGSSAPGETTGASAPGSSGEMTTHPTTSGATVDPTSGPDSSSTSAGTASTEMTTAVTASTGAEGTASTGSEETTSEGTGTGADETTSAGEEESTGDATTGGGNGDYAAFYLAGGLDRIVVRKRDLQADLCTTVIFVWPGGMDPPGFVVELPGEWGWQNAMVHEGAADCHEFMMFPMNPAMATAGVGAAAWVPENGCPTTLDIDVDLTFEMTMPWVPLMDQLAADAIPVQGC